MHSVRRFISAYRNSDEVLECEIDFYNQPSLELLQNIFGAQRDDSMYDQFIISGELAGLLVRFTDHKFDFGKYVYFLSCEAF